MPKITLGFKRRQRQIFVVEYYVTSSNYVAVSDWYYQGDYWWWGYNGGWYIYSPHTAHIICTLRSLVTTMTSRALVDSEETQVLTVFNAQRELLRIMKKVIK